MQSIKRKLSSQSGGSMLLALVFLLFCLFVGGSVLASATANGGRVNDLKASQQEYLTQRSAMLLMADMLESNDGSDLQLTIKEEKISDGSTETVKVTFTILDNDFTKSTLEKILYETVVKIYLDSLGANAPAPENQTFQNFSFIGMTPPYKYETPSSGSGDLTITSDLGEGIEAEVLPAKYSISNFDLTICFDGAHGTIKVNPLLTLTMNGTYSAGNPITITTNGVTTTTTTSVVRWEAPVIRKGGS